MNTVAWFVIGSLVGASLWSWAMSAAFRRDRARDRRVGWAFGYGAGVVDGRHGRYDPQPHATTLEDS